MNVAFVSVAVTLVCAFGPMTAHAQSSSVSAREISSTASVSVAGVSVASSQAMPGFPLKAYRNGYREGRVVLGYTVNADGTVGNVEVLDANPVHVFPRTASNAVAAWRFASTGASERRSIEFRFTAE